MANYQLNIANHCPRLGVIFPAPTHFSLTRTIAMCITTVDTVYNDRPNWYYLYIHLLTVDAESGPGLHVLVLAQGAVPHGAPDTRH